MQKTLLTILTDASARRSEQVMANLSEEFTAGFPWYSKDLS